MSLSLTACTVTFHSLNDENWVMMKSMLSMLFMVIFMGSILSWLIFPSPIMICLPLELMLLALLVGFIGALIGYELSKFSIIWYSNSMKFYNYSYFFGSMWFMPNISTFSMNYIPLIMSYNLFKSFDQGWNEYLGGQGLFNLMKNNSIIFQLIQNNNMKIYLMMMIFWFMLLFMFI